MASGAHRLSLLLALLPLLGVGSGCATIFSGASQSVTLSVQPEDAEVLVDGTPRRNRKLELSRGDSHVIEFRAQGYETKRMYLNRSVNGVTFINLLFWPGFIIDAISGSINKINPDHVAVRLDRSTTFAANPGPLPASPAPAPSATSAPEPEPSPRPSPAKAGLTRATETQQLWIVAVMKIEAAERAKLALRMLEDLTDQFRVFLAERNLRVIDRGTQEEALRSIIGEEKKKSYAECVDSSCQIPLGKVLAATHILRSSIARFGKTCTSNAELIDLRSEVTVAAGSTRSGCGEEELLDASERLAEELVRDSQ